MSRHRAEIPTHGDVRRGGSNSRAAINRRSLRWQLACPPPDQSPHHVDHPLPNPCARHRCAGPAATVGPAQHTGLCRDQRALHRQQFYLRRLRLAYLFIAHDLSVVRHVSDRIAVMVLGRIVEVATRDAIYKDPLHPYTQALLAAVPVADPAVEATRPRSIVIGEVPSAMNPPPGCRFHTRCPQAFARCKTDDPVLSDVGDGRAVACHLHGGGG